MSPLSIAGAILGTLVIAYCIYQFGVYMNDTYITTLNYVDPAIRPLYLPAYSGIQEVIPLGLDRSEITEHFDQVLLGVPSLENPTTPISPSFSYGF
jgi:hypothetical protein